MANRNPTPSLKKNFVFSAGNAIMNVAFPLVTMAYVARVLGPESLGKYYFASSFTIYFLFLAGIGIPMYGAREIGRARGNPARMRAVFSQLFLLNLVASVLAWLIYVTTATLVPHLHAEAALFWIFGIMILSNAVAMDYFFAGIERQDQMAARSLFSKVVSLGLTFWLVRSEDDYLWFAAIGVFAAILHNLLALSAFRNLDWRAAIDVAALKRHLSALWIFAICLLFINVYTSLDTVMLGLLSSPHEVGLYSAAIRPARLAMTLLFVVGAVALPRLAHYGEQGDRTALHELQRKNLDFLLFISLPGATFVAVCAESIVRVIYGPGFAMAEMTMRLAAPIIVLGTVGGYLSNQILITPAGERRLIVVAAAGAAGFALAAATLIPNMGRDGAVLGVLLAEAVVLLALLWMLRGTLPKGLFRNTWRYVLGSGVFALTARILVESPADPATGLAASLIVGAMGYAVCLWLLREPVSRELAALVMARVRPRGGR